MVAVVDLAGVTIVRNGATLINDITWRVDEADRWVIIGPNGAGKTTLLQVISAQIHPTAGVAGLLGEVLGTVDVFELRPRIGLDLAGREALVRTLGELARDAYAPASVLVTHHVEEIPAGITHAMLMKRGE